ncbi:hypothetical protein V2G26_005473 [Clonostachys chloroleuca]
MRARSVLFNLPLVVSATPIDAPFTHNSRSTDASSILWKSCTIPIATSVPVECGSLNVPLDYTEKNSSETLRLDLVRIPAVQLEKKGSILFNFGGPGADGVVDLGYYSEPLLASTGGYYDLINVVPRGTGYTLPFSCYDDAATRSAFTQPINGDSSDTALGNVWARSTIYDQNCAAHQNKTGSLIGTAFVVRDLFQVVDALNEDGLLRYWGVSYGTILGATAVAMFPDRVDKVIIDGVVNPHEYYNNKEVELFTNSDDVFTGFCQACVQNPDNCPLAQNHTAAELEASLRTLLSNLKYHPIPFVTPLIPGGGFVLDYSTVVSYIHRQLYFPFVWPSLANFLHDLATGGLASLAALILNATISDSTTSSNATSDWNPPSFDEAVYGIKCSDILVDSTYEETAAVQTARYSKSIFGGVAAEMPARCAQWPMRAKERYSGDFKVKPRNPVLIIGNTYDPVTPLVSARNVSAGFEGSVVLQQDSYGHDSLTQASLCTAKAVRSYFINGTLPAVGTVCPVDIPVFSGSDGWAEVIKQLAEES